MPRKKAVKKKTSKKVKKSTENSAGSKRKINVVIWNLILFVILAVASYVLCNVSGSDFYQDLFFLLSVILGFVALAFLIAFLVTFLLRVRK